MIRAQPVRKEGDAATLDAIADELFGSGRYSPIGKARK